MRAPQKMRRSRFGILVAAALAPLLVGSGCSNGGIGEPGTSCQSTRTYFLNEVWGPVLQQRCLSCHAPGGTAQLQGARFQLLPASYPDFADQNLANVTAMVTQSYMVGGRPMPAILAKPTGSTMHGGGSVLQAGSPEHNAISALVARIQNGEQEDESCRDYGSLAAPSGVVLSSWRQTLRKAALDMLGRLPTDAEYAGAATEEGFERTVLAMMEEPAFFTRWRTAWNDLMLTDRYVSTDGCDQRALNMIASEDFPNRGSYGGGAMAGLDCCNRDRMNPMCGDVRDFFLRANNAIAQEPINLFEHIVRNNRPFSEILTADYTLVNAQSAFVYGVSEQVGFNNQYANNGELRQARIRYNRRYQNMQVEMTDFPHAGVLTMPAFISRYPTTTTNRNRHRARIVQAYFLATDILKVGERPLDPTASEALVQAPTLNYGPCVTCHRINDPIAGAFRGFFPSGNTQWRYDPRDAWYTDMFPPGFNGEVMPGANYRSALQWMAPRIVQDPRFVSSVVRFIFKSLTGREPLVHPTDQMAPDYAVRSEAWNEQDRIFRAIGRRFTAENMNFRIAVLEMLKSPIYRATGIVLPRSATTPEATQREMDQHTGLGTAMLLTPELLDRRIRAIAGFGWVRSASRDASTNGRDGWLTNDFYFPYGGINSDTIVRRVTDPSGIIVGVAQRMANEIACRTTAFDFTREQAARRFFTGVQLNTVPEAGGATVPANVELIKRNIIELHQRILGEELTMDSPEVERTYQLFLETWREVTTPAMGSTMASTALIDSCHAIGNPATGETLPMPSQIRSDANGTIRAWIAVLSYLFSDYRFLYQ